MTPDLSKPARTGWLVLAGTIVVAVLGLWLVSDDGTAGTNLAKRQIELKHNQKGESAEARLAAERAAVDELRHTINVLKLDAGFQLLPRFQVPTNPSEERLKQPGYFLKQRLLEVRGRVHDECFRKSITYDEALGFSTENKVAPDEEAPYQLAMLQLTERTVNLLLATPHPISSFAFTKIAPKPVETGPANRPPLLREYILEVKVVGGLEDILWILHQLSQVDTKDPTDYPLVLQHLAIDSNNPTARDEITQLTAIMRVAGMQFLSDAERGAAGSEPARDDASRTRARP
jgi:hypothetical protein